MPFYARNMRYWPRQFTTLANPKGIPETIAPKTQTHLKTALVFDQSSKLSGTITKNSAPVERVVLAISEDGLDIKQGSSDINGNYEITGVRGDEQYNLVAIAQTEGFISKAQGPIFPTAYTLPADTPIIVDETWNGFTTDADFNSVTSLIDFNTYATNTTIIDEIISNEWTCNGNTVTQETTFKYGNAALYVGNENTGNGLSLNDPTLAGFDLDGDFTIEAWVYVTGNSENSLNSIFTKADLSAPASDAFNCSLFFDTINYFPRITFNTDDVGSPFELTSTQAVTLNTWTHVAFVMSSGTLEVYVGGISGGTLATLGTPTINDTPTYIGAVYDSVNGFKQCFKGYIDEFRLTKGVARYTAPFAPPTDQYPTDPV